MLNLSWGNPEFLYNYWHGYDLTINTNFYSKGYLQDGLSELKQLIKALHNEQNNAIIDNQNIIIGNGATQCLMAAMWALNKPVYAKPPYYTRFPILCEYTNVPFSINSKYQNEVQIITYPNNPDFRDGYEDIDYGDTIWDLSYNWNTYINTLPINEDIMVFSLAKAMGHASTRIGWAIVKDNKIADKMLEYIENSSMGASLEAQLKTIKLIKTQLNNKDNIFNYGRAILDGRWNTINNTPFPFTILNKRGMFAWCKGEIPDNVMCLRGDSFGVSPDFFRLNVGCYDDVFAQFIRKYK